MKVNLYRDAELLVLKVDADFEITEVLFNFLAHVQEVDEASLEVIGENTIRFAIEEEIDSDQFKDWKLSIINSVREMLSQDEEELKANYLISHQQLEAIEREFTNTQAQLLQARLETMVANKYAQGLLAITGLAVIVSIVAVIVAIVGVIV